MTARVMFYSPLELYDTGNLEDEQQRSLYVGLLLSDSLPKQESKLHIQLLWLLDFCKVKN